ncbi:MAG: hypothetical protein H6Q61_693, partial [Firmicutes bacterium]|nr:hypothetical protein [Bacillota bacterium]
MGNTVVVYKSHYGFTQQYAQWIAEDLGAELRETSQTKPADLKNYDAIIFGGGLYAGGVSGISLLTKSYPGIMDKALFLFTVGAADVTDERNIRNIRTGLSKTLTSEMQSKIQIFHLRGGMDYTKMSLVHRTMMSMMISTLKKKPECDRNSEEQTMLDTYGQRVDFTD